MTLTKSYALFCAVFLVAGSSHAHYPYVAPLNYQTFNNHSAIVSGFYDNPFVSEIAIKNFNFTVYTPEGKKLQLKEADWAKTQTLSSYSLENKTDGTYRIRGEKLANKTSFAFDQNQWKTLIHADADPTKPAPANVVYASQLSKKTKVKTVQTVELIETFVSRRNSSSNVLKMDQPEFNIEFLSHPNAIQNGQPIQLKVLDKNKGVENLKVEILAQTTDYSRDGKVYKNLETDQQGNLNFSLADKGQYLLKIDYQQPFSMKADELKRFKYTLSFNVN